MYTKGIDPGRSSVRAMVAVLSALVLAALPFFMIGGLAVQLRDDLGLSEAALGAAVTLGFLSGAATAPLAGRLADRIGAKPAVYIGAAISTFTLLGIGLVADNWATLVALLCVGNLSIALTDPGLAILISRAVPQHLHGLAFGIKEASIPTASLLAGLAVPTIALTVGWRWAFALGLLPLAVVILVIPGLPLSTPSPQAAPTTGHRQAGRLAVGLTALGAMLGTAAASGAGIFITESAVAAGLGPGQAGLLLAAGSVAGIITRITTGISADRTTGPRFGLIALLMAIGSATMLLGASGRPLPLTVATLGSFSAGWGWTGIYFLSLVRINPSRPGAAAGIGTASLGLGNAGGPLLFGLAAGSLSYSAAWSGAAVTGAVGSGLMLAAQRRMQNGDRGTAYVQPR